MKTLSIILSYTLLCALLASCDTTSPPAGNDCNEFPYKTTHAGKPVVCQILWCNKGGGEWHQGSGMATLWCDSLAPTPSPAQ